MKALRPEDRLRLWKALGIGPQWHRRTLRFTATISANASSRETEVNREANREANREEDQIAGDPADPVTANWDSLSRLVRTCTRCGLSRTRSQTVFGVGHLQAHVMAVGEAPGADEDARGEPFVGQAGKLLDQMLQCVGLSRDAPEAERACYVANVLKCRPPGNRNPAAEEVASCEPYLLRQIALVQPRVIIVMGRFAAQLLLGSAEPIGALRGKVHEVRVGQTTTIKAVVTYHPAYLLRNLTDKAKAWSDLCLAMHCLSAQKQDRARRHD